MTKSLQLVGLAFERNLVLCSTDKNLEERESFENVTFVDIVHYAFNYIGLLTGKKMCVCLIEVQTF